MRFLAAVLIGIAAGTGAVFALVHDQTTVLPAPVQALFSNFQPYSPAVQYGTPAPSSTWSSSGQVPFSLVAPAGTGTGTGVVYNYGSGG